MTETPGSYGDRQSRQLTVNHQQKGGRHSANG